MNSKKLSTWQIVAIAIAAIIVINLLYPVIRFIARLATVLIIAALVVYLISRHSNKA